MVLGELKILIQFMDEQIRLAAFSWLRQQTDIYGDVLTRDFLRRGFVFEEKIIPLVSPREFLNQD